MSKFVVAVDGPAGSGKSSVSKAAAVEKDFGYLDTGAGYRAFTLHAINNHGMSLQQLIESFDYEISLDPKHQFLNLDGEDITEVIRTPMVAERVSEYAREPLVRALQLQDAQNRINSCEKSGIVVEGRDIATVVAPDAQVRVLLTASEAVRLRRRGLEETETAENLKERDSSDSKIAQFMIPAPGVTLLDTSDLDFKESVAALVALIDLRINV